MAADPVVAAGERLLFTRSMMCLLARNSRGEWEQDDGRVRRLDARRKQMVKNSPSHFCNALAFRGVSREDSYPALELRALEQWQHHR